MSFARTDRSLVAQWWWTIDRWSLVALAGIIGFGSLLIMAASPAVADRIHAGGIAHPDDLFFVKRYFAVLPAALALMFVVSLQTPRTVRRIAMVGFVLSLILLAYTLVGGVEIKGARRWISLPGLSLQPSEFVKPCFAVVSAWLFSQYRLRENFPGHWIAMGLYLVVVTLLIKQPDLGQTGLVSAVWFTQFFLAGLRLYWVAAGMASGVVGLIGAYVTLPHVASRIDRFLDPASGDSYQVDRSMDAFMNGGLWGRGPGEGTVKESLPDAHADFVFAVAGEELGLIACLVIVALFAFIVLRGFSRLLQETNLFIVLAATGLFVQFGLQAIINMASTLHLMPTKGMTLPFISYGGSSLLSLGLAMGMALALTRRRFGGVEA
ncbi:MAG TPA: putative peptidoglycan glycosyltransferase FtsW [Stellaceae bacterium]|jgi:cell division protein FtsW|nr:putative peptidoglycan glycosyltransferase FtsW [Stellaceae bacterium]